MRARTIQTAPTRPATGAPKAGAATPEKVGAEGVVEDIGTLEDDGMSHALVADDEEALEVLEEDTKPHEMLLKVGVGMLDVLLLYHPIDELLEAGMADGDEDESQAPQAVEDELELATTGATGVTGSTEKEEMEYQLERLLVIIGVDEDVHSAQTVEDELGDEDEDEDEDEDVDEEDQTAQVSDELLAETGMTGVEDEPQEEDFDDELLLEETDEEDQTPQLSDELLADTGATGVEAEPHDEEEFEDGVIVVVVVVVTVSGMYEVTMRVAATGVDIEVQTAQVSEEDDERELELELDEDEVFQTPQVCDDEDTGVVEDDDVTTFVTGEATVEEDELELDEEGVDQLELLDGEELEDEDEDEDDAV